MRLVPLILLSTVLPLLGACGGSDVSRPEILGTRPAEGSLLDNVVGEIAVYYNQPVRVLNPNAVFGALDTGRVRMIALVDDDDPRILRVRPAPGTYLLPGTFSLRINAGLVTTYEGQYDLVDWSGQYELGTGPNLFVGSRGRSAVVELDPETFEEIDATPTPGGRAPWGLFGTQITDDVRVWTQLESGDGVGRSLAWFRPGDATMTEMSLTTAGDLRTERPTTIFSGRDGRTLYVGFRDTGLGQIRLTEIDVVTATETRTLVLSPEAGADTWPLAVRTSPLNSYVYVSATTASGDVLCRVDVDTWEEADLGPGQGVDGVPLPSGGGSLQTLNSLVYVSNLPKTTANLSLVDGPNGVLSSDSVSEVVGTPWDSWITPDSRWLIQGLNGYAQDAEMCLRLISNPWAPEPLDAVSDSGAGNPLATAIRKITTYRTQARFLTLFDNDTLATYTWDTVGVTQDDLDDGLEGIQAADISTVAPDALTASFVSGSFPP